jgi:thiosulfate dehydrogenase [quinone] large subunit
MATGPQNVPSPPQDIAAEQGVHVQSGRRPTLPLIVVAPIRIFLAVGWLRATAEKAVDAEWWRGRGVTQFLTTERALALPFVRPLMDGVFRTGAPAIAQLVLLGELAAGLAIASGRCLRLGLRVAVVLNVAFVLCGRVNPSAFYLVMEIALLFAFSEGAIGGTATTPSRRATFVWAAVATAAGVAMMPFIVTLRPAEVIDDPAAMLAFLGLVVGLLNAARWAERANDGSTARRFAAQLASWTSARSAPTHPRLERAALPGVARSPDRIPPGGGDVGVHSPSSAAASPTSR